MYDDSKRHFLRSLTAIMGATAASSFLTNKAFAVAMAYQAQSDGMANKGQLFSQSQMQVLAKICEVVIPKTDTPSAAELDVHGFLDNQLAVCHSKDERVAAKNIVDRINVLSVKNYSKEFLKINANEQQQLLIALEQNKLGFIEQDLVNFKQLKSLMVFGFFTTEVGATQVLNYQAMPGQFIGSVDYSILKKSWGSLGFY